MDIDPRIAIISNEPRPLHTHLCNALGHEGPLEYECSQPRCLMQIPVMPCPTCEGPQKRANHPHPKVRWSPPAQPGQRVLPHQ